MSKLIYITAGLTVLGAGVAPAMTKPTPRKDGVVLKLEQIKEVRRQDFPADGGEAGFTMFDTPGLELRFAMEVPRGRQIISVKQPATLDAVDSKGTDLSVLPAGSFGRGKHVDTVREWDKPPHALTFKLALPARDAKHFSLTARMDALTYRDLKEGTIIPEMEWTPVTDGMFGEKEVRVRLERKRGNVHVVFEPGTLRDMIEEVELEQSGTALESEGVMWNDLQVGYMFTVKTNADAELDTNETARFAARVKVRQGLKTVPMEINIEKHPLP